MGVRCSKVSDASVGCLKYVLRKISAKRGSRVSKSRRLLSAPSSLVASCEGGAAAGGLGFSVFSLAGEGASLRVSLEVFSSVAGVSFWEGSALAEGAVLFSEGVLVEGTLEASVSFGKSLALDASGLSEVAS